MKDLNKIKKFVANLEIFQKNTEEEYRIKNFFTYTDDVGQYYHIRSNDEIILLYDTLKIMRTFDKVYEPDDYSGVNPIEFYSNFKLFLNNKNYLFELRTLHYQSELEFEYLFWIKSENFKNRRDVINSLNFDIEKFELINKIFPEDNDEHAELQIKKRRI